MSGGSFDYLYARHSLPELLERTDSIDTMGQALRNAGQNEAAAATESVLADIKAFEEAILARVENLRGIWKAVEWTHSGDWGPESITEEAEVFNAKPTVQAPKEPMTTLNPAVVTDSTGTYLTTVLASPEDAARLQGEYIEADDMYRRAGTGRAEWVQLTGSVLIERLGEDGKPLDQDVLLASEFNARFRSAVPVQ